MLRSSRACHLPPAWKLLGALCSIWMLGALLPGPADAQDDGEGFAAYVNTTALNLRADPGTKSAVVGILLKYDRIRVLERAPVGRSTWYSIEASAGYTNGWVHGGYIEFGDPPSGIFPERPVDYGEPETPTLVKGPWKYQGAAAKCAECHAEPTGDFHLGASKVWGRHVHSSAYQTLKRDYTKEIAKRTRGIDDPLTNWRCVKCHVTAYGADDDQLASSYSHDEGVTCEVCHGPSSEYADRDHGPGVANREAMGFRILTDLTQRREVCTSCHNPASPTYKPFNLREFSRDIAHWVDKDDSDYYADASAEARRRDAAVERARKAKAEKALAARRKADEERREAEAAAAAEADRKAAEAEKMARAEAEAARSQAERESAERRRAEEERKAADAEAARIAAEEKRKADEERRKAEAALAQKKAEGAERERQAEAARKKAEADAREAAAKSSGIEKYLEDVDDVIVVNTDGEKYNSFEFSHLAHASNQYLPDGTCVTCHHTQEGDESPEACSSCHEIGGEADEERSKARAYHKKSLGFPPDEDQEQVSCVGCHKSQNELLAMGKRDGDKAPTKCTLCHTRKK